MNDVNLRTQIKLNIHIDPVGSLTMDDYDFIVEAYTSLMKIVNFKKAGTIRVDENNYFLPLDTAMLGTGHLMCRVIATLPDPDMPEGTRREISVIDTGINIVAK